MGIPLGDIIFDVGGGILKGKQFKAVQTGGPLGGCLPVTSLNTPVDFDSLTEAGAVMGSGGMIVLDDETCMVEFSKYFLTFASGRVVRQVCALPRRRPALAGDPDPDQRRSGNPERSGEDPGHLE